MPLGELAGLRALVAGGAGEVGEGIVRAFLRAGAEVVVPSRDPERLEALRGRLEETLAAPEAGRLATLAGEIGEPEGAARLREAIACDGSLHAVVVSVGGWWQGGPLWEVPVETWERLVASNLTSHFLIARTFLPLLLEAGRASYTAIAGGAAVEPVRGAAPIAATVGGVRMMLRALAVELADTEVRANEILIHTPVATRSRRRPGAEWVTATQVGEIVATLAAPGSTRGTTIELRSRAVADAMLAGLRSGLT